MSGKTTLAYFTFVSWFVMSILHVRFDSGNVLAGVSADAAYDGRFTTMNLIHVLFQVVFYFKLLIADRTRMLKAAGVFPYKVIL